MDLRSLPEERPRGRDPPGALSGSDLAIVTACAAVPASSSAYVLARQMGGDAPLLAQVITLQTILAVITMPIAIALAAMC